MEKNLFSIREAGRQGGRARGGSASLPADGSEVALSLLMLPEVALLIHEGREVARWLSLLMVARWQGGRAASLMVARWQRCQRWLCLPADGSKVARWLCCLPGGSDASRGGRGGSLPADGSEVAEVALPAFQFYLSASDGSKVARWLCCLPGGSDASRGGRGGSLPADGSKVAEVAESHLLLYIYVIDVIGLH